MLGSFKTLVIIVNYNSALLTLRAVKSVLESDSVGPVDVAVVDNSASLKESDILQSQLPSSVAFRRNTENMGFGFACNQAFEEFESDGILLINPDAQLLPGCLKQLQKTLLSNKQVAAVAPQLFWDDAQTFYLPPPHPTVLFEFRDLLVSWSSEALVNRTISLLWRRHSVRVWRAEKPVVAGNLSGGLVFLNRTAVKQAGGLFDPRFFLYFEDTDLSLRLRKSGYTLLINPKARAVHHYDQCGQDQWRLKRELMVKSYAVFLEKHKSFWKSSLKKVLASLPHPSTDASNARLPVFNTPFSLEVLPRFQNEWLFEWSPNPDLTPSAARFGSGPEIHFPETCWRLLAPGRYFGRLGSSKRFFEQFQKFSWVIDERS